MLLLIYRIVVFILYALAFPVLGALALAGSVKWRNRLGRGFSGFPSTQSEQESHLIWAHAASAGEAQVLSHFVKAYHKRASSTSCTLRFVVTVVTDSGYDTAKAALAELIKSGVVEVFYLPLDCPQSINKALNQITPDLFLFTETEIWPCWTSALIARKIPYALLNARLTERSFRKYMQAHSLVKRAMQNYEMVICQAQEHLERFKALGVPQGRLCHSGNIKSDAPVNHIPAERKRHWRETLGVAETDFLLVFGSIRSGEFTGALELFQHLSPSFPQLRIAIAPRHLERCAEIASEAHSLGIATQTFSKDAKFIADTNSHVTIINSFGVLRELYGASDLAFVGATMIPIGGHNILEPPQVGTPVLFGPHTANVTEAVALIKQRKCGLQVRDWKGLTSQVELALKGEHEFSQWDAAPSESNSESAMDFTIGKVETLVSDNVTP